MNTLRLFLGLLLGLLAIANATGNGFKTPSQARNFTLPTTYAELKQFIRATSHQSPLWEYEVLGKSVEGREIFVVRTISSKPSMTGERLRILIFSQQHGNEQSTKEAALLLIAQIANGKHPHWLRNADLWIIPQVNPDASEVNQRRNAQDLDLNRDHVLLQSPEVVALHELFHRIKPHVTVDVHEYQPYRPSWADFGGFKFFDVQVGILTNPNVSQGIRDYSLRVGLTAIENSLVDAGFSFHNYLIGPAPNEGLTRFSTVNINDGRQGLGIMGGMSFIYEGINGRDNFAHNLDRRTISQTLALEALVDRLVTDNRTVIRLVERSRQRLNRGRLGSVAIRMDHFRDNNPLMLPLLSSKTGKDTLAVVENFYPVVRPTLSVEAPKGYLVPKNDTILVELLRRHKILLLDEKPRNSRVYGYTITENRVVEAESSENAFPQVQRFRLPQPPSITNYFFVPLTQLKSLFLVLILEPQSQIGLAQYEQFQYLFRVGEKFPILRVE
ncbi:MAG TPA: hypothetical protein DCM62_08770 [Bacteroidales bacterium]|nr:hypothetical protein [Bacteroidales bacterium]